MSNTLMPTARKAFLDADLDWLAQDFRVVFVDTGQYTFSSAHEFLSSVPSGARAAVSGALTGKTSTGGVADADNVTVTIAGGQPTAEGFYVYQHTGSDATARLVAWFDTASGGLPAQPGGDTQIIWAAGGIFIV